MFLTNNVEIFFSILGILIVFYLSGNSLRNLFKNNKRRKRAEVELDTHLAKEHQKPLLLNGGTHFYGVDTAHLKKETGHGILVLTEKYLIFQYYRHNKHIQIPLKKIKRADKRSSYGHILTFATKAFRVTYLDEEHRKSHCAWQVKNPSRWVHKTRNLMRKSLIY